MLGFSLPEILFLAVLALVVIGPKQLPEVARTLGRFLNELRRASSSLTDEFKSHIKIDPIRMEDKPLPPHYHNHTPPEAQDAIAEPEIKPEPTTATETEKKPHDPGSSHQ